MPRKHPSIEPLPKMCPDQQEDRRARDHAATDHQQDRACDPIVDKFKRPRQACDDNECQHEYTHDPVNQYRIGRNRPARAFAGEKPYARAVAANCRWQDLIEKCGDKTELQCRPKS
jgi:hypothetical protein